MDKDEREKQLGRMGRTELVEEIHKLDARLEAAITQAQRRGVAIVAMRTAIEDMVRTARKASKTLDEAV